MCLGDRLGVSLPDGVWSCGEVALPRLAVGVDLCSSASRIGAVVSTGMPDLYVMVVARVGSKPGVVCGR